MKKIIKFSAVSFMMLSFVLFGVGPVYGANDVTTETGVSIVLPSNSQEYVLGTDTTAQSFTVNNGNIEVVLEASSKFEFTSADRTMFTFIGGPSTCSHTISCNTDSSYIAISCDAGTSGSGSMIITPNGTCTDTTTNSGSSSAPISYSGNGGSSAKKKTVKNVEPVAGAEACALDVGYAYKSTGSSAVYYVTEDCEKRAFSNATIFFSYFDSWDDVKSTSNSKLEGIANDSLGFMPWGKNYDPKYGALVKIVKDPKVYMLLGTERYWITSETVFETLNYKWNWIEDIDQALLDKYTVGSEISYLDHHPNYTIVKYAGSTKVYRLEPDPNDSSKQVKRHVLNEAAFNSLGFRWDRIVEIGDDEVYEDGEAMGANTTTLTKFLSLGSNDAEVLILQQKLRDLGYFTHAINTGYYGAATVEAVKAFQAANGLDVAGYVGPGTRAALNAK